jgi:phosphatidylglycerophosphatase A
MPDPGNSPSPTIRFRLAVATCFGLGYAPAAPGTVGSLPGVLLAFVLASAGGWPAALTGAVAVALIGLWAAGGAAARLGEDDPRPVVIDETAGQMVTLLFLPPTPAVLAAGFAIFRILDIAKPPPIRRLESLPGGSGIMADDLVAGVYGNLLLQAAVRAFPGLLGLA